MNRAQAFRSGPSRPATARRVWPMTLLVALAFVLPGCASGTSARSQTTLPVAQPDGTPSGLDAYVTQAVADWEIAGLSIAVVKDGEVVFARGYGERELGGGVPVDEHTLFAIGSNTKLFAAVAAGMMVDDGRMSWDDPATRHLPGFQLFDPYVTREITIRDLLSHRSGLGRRGDMLWYGTEFDRAEILRRIRYLEPNSSFRSEWGYQNVMFLAAGEATAAAAGRDWDTVIRERIFTPLGMRRSNSSTNDLPGDDNVATPHVWAEGALRPVPWRNLDNVAPAGSINSSAHEMTEWLRFLLDEGRRGEETLLESSTLREIFTPHSLMNLAPDPLFPSVHFLTYGLGVVMQDYRGKKALWHTGGIDGMLSLFGLIPEEGLGVVVLTNTAGRNNLFTALMYTVFDAYLGGPETDWSAVMLEQSRAAEARGAEAQRRAEEARVTGTTPSLGNEAYVGRYEHPIYGEASVALENGRLVLRRGPAFTGDLEHWHYDTFRASWRSAAGGTAMVTFGLDFMGKVKTLEVQGVADFQRVEG